ncbi:MAG TPA: PHP domain-containing protein [Deltaproteobacteria bacterium]|nr:PHP domain-containing protein [Deltaproteobacteria bacterium]
MSNDQMAGLLLEAAEALEFLEENPFKAKAFRKAAESIVRLDKDVADLVADGTIHLVKGIGPSIASVVRAWVTSGDTAFLDELKSRLPSGYAELRKVQGLGPRRIRRLFEEYGIQGLEDLASAIDEGRLAGSKGFTEKTLDKLRRSVAEALSYRGLFLLDEAWAWMETIRGVLAGAGIEAEPTGESRRGMEVLGRVELLCAGGREEALGVASALEAFTGRRPELSEGRIAVGLPGRPELVVHLCPEGSRATALFFTTGAPEHVEQLVARSAIESILVTKTMVSRRGKPVALAQEGEIYGLLGMREIPPEAREGRAVEWDFFSSPQGSRLVDRADVKGVFHVHTSASDGKASLQEMVMAAGARGYSWVGVSDHSRSAYYAGGLSVEGLEDQCRAIDALNEGSAGITVLKGVESDILPDGSLDYPDEVLQRLDFVIASVHSHMDMDRAAMTRRVLRALENPRTSVLGHPTGRLLLSRRPYELDVDAVLDAASRLGVIVELNAHPMRLDLDWRLIRDFTGAGGLVAVNPDAHEPSGYDDMRYGLVMARKGLLSAASCVNCMDVREVREVVSRRWS